MIAVPLLLAAAVIAHDQGQPPPSPGQVRAAFRQPPKRYRPMVRWFWPGGDVRDDQLKREIGLLDEAHFGGAEIQPFRLGLDPRAPVDVLRRVHDYRTPSFFGHVRAALEEAARREMWIDYTMGSGWPFGGGMTITPERSGLELRLAHRAVAGGHRFSGPIPWPTSPPGFGTFVARITGAADSLPAGWAARLAAREKLVAVVAVRGSAAVIDTAASKDLIGRPVRVVKRRGALDLGSTVVLTDRVKPDRMLDWTPPEGEWQLFVMVQAPTDERVLGGVGGPQLVADHLDRHAIEAHLAAVGDSAVKYLRRFVGTTWRGVFIDSLELAAELCWTDAFLTHFRRLRGYDLTPFLPLLDRAYDAAGVGDRIRHDFDETVADLLTEQAFGSFAHWATRHRMVSRIQGHDAWADQERLYSLATIPETENLHAGGRYDLLKLASSAAHAYGRPITSAESFVWIMEEYQTTPEKMKRQADEMIAAGVNQIVASGFPYEYLDRPEPGWYPFVAPFPYGSHLNHHDPFWRFLPALNDYITRLQFLSQIGETVAPIAVLQADLAFSHRPADAPVVRFVRDLLGAGYDFDYLNGPAILGSRVAAERLVSPGGARYEALVLVDAAELGVEIVGRLAAFGRAGLPIIVAGKRPSDQPGYRNYRAGRDRIRGLIDAMERFPSVVFAADPEEAVNRIRSTVRPTIHVLEGSGAGINSIAKRIGSLDAYFLRTGSTEATTLTVRFPRALGAAERWDPWDGTAAPVAPVDDSGSFKIDLEPLGSALIVFDRAARPMAAAPEAVVPPPRIVEIGGGPSPWRFEAKGRLGQDGETRVERTTTKLFDWATDSIFKNFSGNGTYSIRFALDSADLVGTRTELDLGQVRDVAEVTLNGVRGPALLLRPYRRDVTGLVRPGWNELQVTVTNPPLNRMIGAGAPLGMLFAEAFARPPTRLPAGLMGPVRLLVRRP
ncbi:MAG: glycosyl hydrolase [Gemmatimonadales bacterium]